MSNDEKIRITFLGTGTSHGIPMIACRCPVCASDDSRDKRHRSSLMVEYGGGVIIIDTTPEFRLQCLANNITRVDAILYTHTHADHIFGLDDLRRFTAMQNQKIPCYGSPKTIKTLKTIFPYAFGHTGIVYSEIPNLLDVEVTGPFEFFGKTIIPLELCHGWDKVLGFRIENIAYCTDCSEIPPAAMDQLHGLDILILDALRYTPHPTHFNLDQALIAAQKINARKTYLTHIAHEIKHADLETKLPANIFLSYDGQQLSV
ncbi:MAG: MBL fold metallo-hydrolase [Phycisphaerae bacterium]